MSGTLPLLVCPRVAFGDLCADPAAEPWRDLEAVEMVEAVSGAAPKQRTWVRVAHDGSEWRVLFDCEDADPWATLTQRDGPLYNEETVEVFFDPVGDLESYYEIEVNPLGAILDLVLRKSRSGYKGDWAWNCEGLRTLVRKEEGLWAVEMAIPFASVGGSAANRWRVNFCRIDHPSRDGSLPRELSAWSAPRRANFHTQERFGVVEFRAF
jgi:hypothetical protein